MKYHRKDYHDHLFYLEENNKELITYAQWCEMQNIRHKRRLPMGNETDKAQNMITLLLCGVVFLVLFILALFMKQQQQYRTMGVPIDIERVPLYREEQYHVFPPVDHEFYTWTDFHSLHRKSVCLNSWDLRQALVSAPNFTVSTSIAQVDPIVNPQKRLVHTRKKTWHPRGGVYNRVCSP